MDRDAVLSLWEAHKDERWPQVGSQHEGPLMTLDTVISGCVVYFLDSPEGLDPQRIGIVEDCVADLDNLTDELDEDCLPYFQRLRRLGALLISDPSHHLTFRMKRKDRSAPITSWRYGTSTISFFIGSKTAKSSPFSCTSTLNISSISPGPQQCHKVPI